MKLLIQMLLKNHLVKDYFNQRRLIFLSFMRCTVKTNIENSIRVEERVENNISD